MLRSQVRGSHLRYEAGVLGAEAQIPGSEAGILGAEAEDPGSEAPSLGAEASSPGPSLDPRIRGRPGVGEAGGARNHLKSLKVALFALFATFSDVFKVPRSTLCLVLVFTLPFGPKVRKTHF